jgi:hypothetical protein
MFTNCKWVVVIEKLELSNFGGEGEKCSTILQVARMFLDIKGLKD